MPKFFVLAMLCLVVACGASVETRTSASDDKVMVRVPAGEFVMGLSDAQERALVETQGASPGSFKFEKPAHTVNVAAFWIDRYLVTNQEYKKFIDANPDYAAPDTEIEQFQPLRWDARTRTFPKGRDYYPVVLVTWYDANAYCQWAGKRLPSEAEWEKAARGTDMRLYPWGSAWAKDKTAFGAGDAFDASPVGKFQSDASPYTAHDMVGNVWQWTSSLFEKYPYHANDGREDLNKAGERVTRGGMFAFGAAISRVNVRSKLEPSDKAASVGFRCAAN
jgi:formylglycine-generating enzyme required for sulfatase activity